MKFTSSRFEIRESVVSRDLSPSPKTFTVCTKLSLPLIFDSLLQSGVLCPLKI